MRALLYTAAFAAALYGGLRVASAQVHASEAPPPAMGSPTPESMDRTATQAAPAPVNSAAALAVSRVFRYDELPVRTSANGSQSRTVTHGTLRTGESVSLHESTQPPASDPVALHVIHHTEFVCVQQGTLAFDHVDAAGETVSEQAGPGSVIYVAEGTSHRIRNTGSGPASYFVVAIGGDAK